MPHLPADEACRQLPSAIGSESRQRETTSTKLIAPAHLPPVPMAQQATTTTAGKRSFARYHSVQAFSMSLLPIGCWNASWLGEPSALSPDWPHQQQVCTLEICART